MTSLSYLLAILIAIQLALNAGLTGYAGAITEMYKQQINHKY